MLNTYGKDRIMVKKYLSKIDEIMVEHTPQMRNEGKSLAWPDPFKSPGSRPKNKDRLQKSVAKSPMRFSPERAISQMR